MGEFTPICLADFAAIKGLALIALALVVWLWWSGFKERRNQRRETEWLENRRRELKEKAAAKAAPPHKA